MTIVPTFPYSLCSYGKGERSEPRPYEGRILTTKQKGIIKKNDVDNIRPLHNIPNNKKIKSNKNIMEIIWYVVGHLLPLSFHS